MLRFVKIIENNIGLPVIWCFYKFPSVLRGNHTSSITATSPKFMCHIYQKLNITALQNCLNWCLIRDMVGQVNVVFSLSFLKPIL